MPKRYPITVEEINDAVEENKPGVYMLYAIYTGPVRYVGRADNSLTVELTDYLRGKYRYFTFFYADSPVDAYLKECNLWHRHIDTIDNKDTHPVKPAGSDKKCPECDK